MTLPNNYVLTPSTNTVFLTPQNFVLGFSPALGPSRGKFRFLKDHYVNDTLIPSGTIMEMFAPWTPTADVEPVDTNAAINFYNQGPTQGACIRTQFAGRYIQFPITFWLYKGNNTWALTGLGATFAPVTAIVPNIEDKGP